MRIVQKESPLALYKGLGAVTAGIVPKMAIRFTTFQFYKDMMVDKDGTPWKLNNFWGKLQASFAKCDRPLEKRQSMDLSERNNSFALDNLTFPRYTTRCP